MTRTLESDIATYLLSEAERVVVYDTLADIEDNISLVPVTQLSQPKRPAMVLIVAAASVAVVAGLAVARDARPRNERAAAQLDTTVPAAPSPTVAPDTTPSTTTPTARVPLPAGAVLQGVTPWCTTLDSIEYDCTIAAYPDVVLIDMTGYTTITVDDTSHISGGCRADSADALKWTCYIGQRAIDEGIVARDSMGDPAPREYAAG